MVARARSLLVISLLCAATLAAAEQRDDDRPRHERPKIDWRREAMQTLRVASAEHLITDPGDLASYQTTGFNAFVVFDVEGCDASGTAWIFKSEEEVRAETTFAREHDMPLVIGLAVEPFTASVGDESTRHRRRPFSPFTSKATLIPGATEDEIRDRIALWKKYGNDIVLAVFPWYDDVFLNHVDVERQRAVYAAIKSVARDWYVLGMIGEFGFNAGDDEVAQLYDPAAFDHLIVLMYPYNLGGVATGLALDNIASLDPDGDMERYLDRYIDRMNEKYFTRLRAGQLVLVVMQAFYYLGEAPGHVPRPADIDIMTRYGGEKIRALRGQGDNYSAAFFYWGGNTSLIGISERNDWLGTVASANADLDRQRQSRIELDRAP